MKKVYITENQLIIIKESDEEVTFFEFLRESKKFLSGLLKDPLGTKQRELFSKHGISKGVLIKKMIDCGLLKKKENITEPYNEETGKKESTYSVSYKVSKKDFDKRMHRLYARLFENKPKNKIEECDMAGAFDGGAFAGTGGDGATTTISSSGQYPVAFSQVQRRPDPSTARFAGLSVQQADDESSKDINKKSKKRKK